MAKTSPISKQSLVGLLIALVLALGTVIAGLLIPKERAVDVFALLLFGIAAVYGGFVFADGRPREIFIELSNFAIVGALTFLGLWISPVWLAVGYFAHGGWDLAHHPIARVVRTKFPNGMQPAVLPMIGL
jgi:hypothetical protein